MASLDDETLNAPLGEAAGYFADATGRSFVLHIADELAIHHTAEAALLRDLFAGRPSPRTCSCSQALSGSRHLC